MLIELDFFDKGVCGCVFVCLCVGVHYVPDNVCVSVCVCILCDIWSGCHADRTLFINSRDRVIYLGGL